MSTETTARNKRFVQLAVTTALATTALTACTAKVAPTHAYSAAHAEAALSKGKVTKAIEHAEAAVLASPRDAYTRTLLANAYLEDGRFVSAATTFAEAIELGDTAPRTVVSHALTLIAVGDQDGAIATLKRFETALDPADFGLAMALAGRPEHGVHVLGNALRAGQNSAKVRQNLAYSYALMGDWRSARLMAAEDVPAGEVGSRLEQWAAMSRPEAFTTRVASLLGVTAQVDPGQPRMLALANFPSVEMLAAQEVEPAAPAAAEDAQTAFAFAGELPASDSAQSFDDSADASLAEAGLAPSAGGIRFVANEQVQHVPAAKAPAAKASAAKGPVAAARVAAVAPSPAPATPRLSLAAGDYNIQLGAYFSMSAAQDAWKLFQQRYPELSDAERVITKARVNGKIYYRVAAAGFAKASADSLCRTVKGKGGGCIAYASSRPLPGAIEMIDKEVRVASR